MLLRCQDFPPNSSGHVDTDIGRLPGPSTALLHQHYHANDSNPHWATCWSKAGQVQRLTTGPTVLLSSNTGDPCEAAPKRPKHTTVKEKLNVAVSSSLVSLLMVLAYSLALLSCNSPTLKIGQTSTDSLFYFLQSLSSATPKIERMGSAAVLVRVDQDHRQP